MFAVNNKFSNQQVLSGRVFLRFHIHLNSKENHMSCAEIPFALGYMVECASLVYIDS